MPAWTHHLGRELWCVPKLKCKCRGSDVPRVLTIGVAWSHSFFRMFEVLLCGNFVLEACLNVLLILLSLVSLVLETTPLLGAPGAPGAP